MPHQAVWTLATEFESVSMAHHLIRIPVVDVVKSAFLFVFFSWLVPKHQAYGFSSFCSSTIAIMGVAVLKMAGLFSISSNVY
jgi:hypothetical protein